MMRMRATSTMTNRSHLHLLRERHHHRSTRCGGGRTRVCERGSTMMMMRTMTTTTTMGLDAESWGGRGLGERRRRRAAAAVSAFSARADEASETSFSSKAQANYVQSLEREIARASPISSEASLADCAYAVATSSATMPLRDRKICALASRAVAAVCETGIDEEDGSLLVALALKSAIERNGDDREIRVVVGYAAVTTYDAETGERRREARARAWVDVEGKIVDACAPGTALCEAARRAGVDYDDESAMATEFGRETLDASGYAPSIDHSRALVVLGVAVPLGGSVAAASARREAQMTNKGGKRTTSSSSHGLTLRPPPSDVEGAEEAVRRVTYYRERVLDGGMIGIEQFKDASPPEARACFAVVADAVVETVASREDRITRVETAECVT